MFFKLGLRNVAGALVGCAVLLEAASPLPRYDQVGAINAKRDIANSPWATLTRRNHQATLLVVAVRGDALCTAAATTLRDPLLAGSDIYFLIQGEKDGDKSQRDLIEAQIGKRGWVLLSPSGRVLASGQRAPKADELLRALDTPETVSPIIQLGKYLKQHPLQIEAREAYLAFLRSRACSLTRKSLGLNQLSMAEKVAEGHYFFSSLGVSLPDLDGFRGKVLGPNEDLLIWAVYGQALDQAFRDGSWSRMHLDWDPLVGVSCEACSPTMQSVFRSHIANVQAELERSPRDNGLWQLWLVMKACLGEPLEAPFLPGLEPPPPEARASWPPDGAIIPLVAQAKRQGRWDLICRLLESYRGQWIQLAETSVASQRPGSRYRFTVPVDWNGRMAPLMEALLRTGKEAMATEIATALNQVPDGDGWLPSAVAIARKCGRADLAHQWGGK